MMKVGRAFQTLGTGIKRALTPGKKKKKSSLASQPSPLVGLGRRPVTKGAGKAAPIHVTTVAQALANLPRPSPGRPGPGRRPGARAAMLPGRVTRPVGRMPASPPPAPAPAPVPAQAFNAPLPALPWGARPTAPAPMVTGPAFAQVAGPAHVHAAAPAEVPWTTHPTPMPLPFQDALHEAHAMFGDPISFPKVKEMDVAYRGEENGTKFGTTVAYFTQEQREKCRCRVLNGLLCDCTGAPVNTMGAKTVFAAGQDKAIFVFTHRGDIFLTTHQQVGRIHHSSLASGAPVAAAGELQVVDGKIEVVTLRSGHYKPSREQLMTFISALQSWGMGPIHLDTSL
jgi:hypothetical protein